MITAVDSNILFDILGDDPEFSPSSQEALQRQHQNGGLVIAPLVFAELLVYFLKKCELTKAVSSLKEFLQDMGITLGTFSEQDYIVAAEAWRRFGGKKEVACPKCGAQNEFFCSACNQKLFWRNHILTDFLIGAHAQNNADSLLTRDRGYYNKYFKVRIIY